MLLKYSILRYYKIIKEKDTNEKDCPFARNFFSTHYDKRTISSSLSKRQKHHKKAFLSSQRHTFTFIEI